MMYKFYVKMDGETYGPYSAKEMLDLGLLEDTLVTEESLNGQWYPASKMDFQDMYMKEASININEDGTITRGDGYESVGSASLSDSGSNNVDIAFLSTWNWGAFVFSWLWGVFNGVYWPLVLILIDFIPYAGPVISLGISVYLGIKGSELAWHSSKVWGSFGEFQETQKKWSKAVLWLLVISLGIGIIAGIAATA